MFCVIWYHLYNLKNVKNTHGGVLLLKSVTIFFKLYKWYQIAQSVAYQEGKYRYALRQRPLAK